MLEALLDIEDIDMTIFFNYESYKLFYRQRIFLKQIQKILTED